MVLDQQLWAAIASAAQSPNTLIRGRTPTLAAEAQKSIKILRSVDVDVADMPPSYLNHPPPSLARAPPRLLFSLHWKGVHNQDDAPTTGSGSGSASATSIPLPPPPSPSPSPHPITAIGWLAASGGCSSGADADADAGAGLAFAVYRCSAAEADRNPEVQYSTAQEQYRTVQLQYSTMQYST